MLDGYKCATSRLGSAKNSDTGEIELHTIAIEHIQPEDNFENINIYIRQTA